ncbi:hypothetical protein B0H10DRAFT_1948602 [Mycena sp. CBHHK59/15]|nr:hypothetical protein B0H10DRAFT_1948602 [Mycena sp. CBHHK59/15]
MAPQPAVAKKVTKTRMTSMMTQEFLFRWSLIVYSVFAFRIPLAAGLLKSEFTLMVKHESQQVMRNKIFGHTILVGNYGQREATELTVTVSGQKIGNATSEPLPLPLLPYNLVQYDLHSNQISCTWGSDRDRRTDGLAGVKLLPIDDRARASALRDGSACTHLPPHQFLPARFK